MGKFEDLTGNTYGRLTVISRAENDKQGKPQWLCLCTCGKACTVRGADLKRKDRPTQSCGCTNPYKFQDLTGETFGRLTVISRAENKGGFVYWNCRCNCESGKIVTVRDDHLRKNEIQSCGCLSIEKTVERSTTHGMFGTPIYRTWAKIKERCTNPHCKSYKNYGGRGIKLFPAWEEFQPFYDYVSQLPHFGEEGYTLDRINNNGNYEPDNLRFATKTEQGRNKRNNNRVEYQGEMLTLAEAAEKSGIKYQTLRDRYYDGKRNERLFRKVGEKL